MTWGSQSQAEIPQPTDNDHLLTVAVHSPLVDNRCQKVANNLQIRRLASYRLGSVLLRVVFAPA